MYLWMKWLHIIAVISWMAGILYLFRLFVNHRERAGSSKEVHELLCGMEFRLYRYITVPAMIVATMAGALMLVLVPGMLSTRWMQGKLVTVFLLMLSTFYAGRLVKRASQDVSTLPSGKMLRFANEVPTLLMMIIVGLVVFKAF